MFPKASLILFEITSSFGNYDLERSRLTQTGIEKIFVLYRYIWNSEDLMKFPKLAYNLHSNWNILYSTLIELYITIWSEIMVSFLEFRPNWSWNKLFKSFTWKEQMTFDKMIKRHFKTHILILTGINLPKICWLAPLDLSDFFSNVGLI